MRLPDGVVTEVEFTAGSWTDISAYVNLGDSTIETQHGRGNPYEATQTGQLALVLDNSDGRFTPGVAVLSTGSANPYYPQVQANVRIRVSVVKTTPYYLFTGYVDSWDAGFPGGYSARTKVTVTASDQFKLLARRKFRTVYEETARVAGAVSYYPLSVGDAEAIPLYVEDSIRSDGAGVVVAPVANPAAVQAYSNDEKPQQMPGSLGFSGAINTGGVYRGGEGAGVVALAKPYTLPDAFELTVACWFKTSTPNGVVANLLDLDGDVLVSVGDGGSGQVNAAAGPAVAQSSAGFNDGEWHHYLVYSTLLAGSWTVDLYLDGELETSGSGMAAHVADTSYSWLLNGSQSNAVAHPPQSPGKAWGSGDVTYSGLIISANDLTAYASDLFHAGRDNISGELVQDRVERYLGWCGLDPTEYAIASDCAAVIGSHDTLDKSALDCLQELATAEGAPVFVDGSGVVTFQSRAHRATTIPAWTFDGSASEVEPGSMRVTFADEGVVNEVTATISGGPSVTAYMTDAMGDVMTDTMSSVPLSPVSDDIDAPWSTIDQAKGAAYKRLSERYQAKLRFGQVVITPARADSDIWASCLGVEVGDLIRVTNIPAAFTGGATQRELFVESVSWSLDMHDMTLTLDTNPIDYALTETAFDDGDCRFGHDAGVMTVDTVSALSGTGTGTFTVATSTGPLWTTTGGAFPLKVRIDEEVMTVSGISGGSSPQTFTVSARGVDGTTPAAHSTGAPVDLWPIPVFAQ